MQPRTAIHKTGSGSRFRPRAPENSPGGRVRLASCIPHSQEMAPAPKKSWFGIRTAELWRFADGGALQYINNYRKNLAAPNLCRFRYNCEKRPRNGSRKRPTFGLRDVRRVDCVCVYARVHTAACVPGTGGHLAHLQRKPQCSKCREMGRRAQYFFCAVASHVREPGGNRNSSYF
jgi:hypothetical protein